MALLAASLADHLQARNAQIAGLLVAGCPFRPPLFRFSRLRFVGYEAADSHLMPEVPVKLNGAAAQSPDIAIFACYRKLVRLVAFLQATGYGLCLGREFPRLFFLCA